MIKMKFGIILSLIASLVLSPATSRADSTRLDVDAAKNAAIRMKSAADQFKATIVNNPQKGLVDQAQASTLNQALKAKESGIKNGTINVTAAVKSQFLMGLPAAYKQYEDGTTNQKTATDYYSAGDNAMREAPTKPTNDLKITTYGVAAAKYSQAASQFDTAEKNYQGFCKNAQGLLNLLPR